MLDVAVSLGSSPRRDDDAPDATQLLIQFVPALLLSTIGAVAATLAAMDHLSGRRPSLSRAFEPIGERFWPLAGTLAVISIAVVGSVTAAALLMPLVVVLALAVLTVYLFVLWLFAPQAAVIERMPVRAALARSRDLVAGAWLQVFGTFLAVQLLTLVAELLLTALVAEPLGGLDLARNTEIVLVGAWNVLAIVVVEPFALIALGLLYLDRRFRTQGGWEAPPAPAE